ncbi:MAG: excinuclease ABC subunit UvrA [Steroidobacteraceae bacterium]
MPPFDTHRPESIRIRGARQNNLKGLDLDLPLRELIVVTGVSGSGKSSLVFDTLYAEGQRRYVETFSPYARQFLDRMDKPQVDRIEGIPPSIAIDQNNPVRTSRSTVGTMTEINDHLKLLFARAAQLYCRGCGRPVHRDTPQSIAAALETRCAAQGDPRLLLTFPVPVPANFDEKEVLGLLERQGYTRIQERKKGRLVVIQDRFRWGSVDRARAAESLEAALRVGRGRVDVYPLDAKDKAGEPWRFSSDLHCADCDIHYQEPHPSSFSFNSPLGACETCRGFGRIIGVDWHLVIPDEGKSLREGCVKVWQTESYRECQDDLMKYARKRGIPVDTPWRELDEASRRWVIEGEGEWTRKVWYGAKRFFAWLETKAYKMHIRVLLSRYRSYTPCPACEGARLKPEALLWRIATTQRLRNDRAPDGPPDGVPDGVPYGVPGYDIREIMLLPVERAREVFDSLTLPAPLDDAAELVLGEIRTRLRYLCEVGLSYLTLDRQSRTLSGGEVQRINLTTALGTSLVNTLFVLDEPSIGLHARDVERIVGVMHRLRDAGNTLVVVEHDPAVMRAADRIIDIGPGPGEHGGRILYNGPAAGIATAPGSLTADYLTGRRRCSAPAATLAPATHWLRLRGAREHNLKDVDVDIPLHRLVCVTGVSGSGKSTLIHDVLYAALLRAKGKPTESPGELDDLLGAELVDSVVMVDQSPIGRTTRSNPASYVGAFDAIRALFAKLPSSRERKYTAGTFSFNAGNGRCPSCGGNGFEHVEMQFLSDVYLRCPDCNGRRFRAEVLECRLQREGGALSIADVLELTVSEALAFFAQDTEVVLRLKPLADVGLDYLRLGQPVPTLSGGEAQRLKLAGHLAENASREQAVRRGASRTRGSLFLFDEPTTGLHFDDITRLLGAFRRLIAAGHSLLVIEHNLEVIGAADWIIDLGPEGGEHGGELVCAGTPETVAAEPRSHTGRALREALVARSGAQEGAGPWLLQPPLSAEPAAAALAPPAIEIRGAREHNLRDLDVDLGRNCFTVITGVSGSGKSTLAFDILFAEGQRRYLESLNAYARQFVQPASRPDVDAIFGIPPTVAIEQRTSRGGRKSTVATLTELYHFMRLLYVKLGVQHCPTCHVPIEPQSVEAIFARVMKDHRGRQVQVLAPLIVSRKGLYTELARWAKNKGFASLRVDGEEIPTRKWPRLGPLPRT